SSKDSQLQGSRFATGAHSLPHHSLRFAFKRERSSFITAIEPTMPTPIVTATLSAAKATNSFRVGRYSKKSASSAPAPHAPVMAIHKNVRRRYLFWIGDGVRIMAKSRKDSA